MSKLVELGKLFHPVQPRAKEGGEGVLYRELAPDPLLSGYICCYWQLKSTMPLCRSFTYTVVTDGCIDFFFDLNDPRENYVMGFSSEHTPFFLNGSFNYAGIRFFPGAFPALYRVKASELTNRCQYIREVVPHAYKKLGDQLAGKFSIDTIKPLLDDHFKKIIFSGSADIDGRLVGSLSTILRSVGNVSVEKAIAAEISPRHLRRLFEFYIGAPPKEFNKVMRFQKFLAQTTMPSQLRHEKIYYDVGYYDQSHFIKDFKVLYGTSPRKAFRE